MDENLREVKYQLFSMKFTPITPSSPMSKSLYHQEDNMNNLEQNVALKISSLDNVVFWHRNLTRGRGFYINGYSSNHYPDFIIYTKKK